jgi:aminopeptidase
MYNATLKSGLRTVTLGNGLYPTEATAKQYGLTKSQLTDLFWSGINIDYRQLQATGEAVRSILAVGQEIHLTHPNGTDFKCRIEGRPVFVNHGMISEEAQAKGGLAAQVFLPAGEVFLAPVPGTAEGKIVIDTLPFEKDVIIGATFTVKADKLTLFSAQPGSDTERWKALYEAAPEGKNEFAALDFGINPAIKAPPGSRLSAWMSAGTVSLGFGGNTWAGGSNHCGWVSAGCVNGCSVAVDDKTMIDRGVLKVQ